MKKDGTFPIKFYVHADILPKHYELCKLISSKRLQIFGIDVLNIKEQRPAKPIPPTFMSYIR